MKQKSDLGPLSFWQTTQPSTTAQQSSLLWLLKIIQPPPSAAHSAERNFGYDVIAVVVVNANWKRQIKLKAATCHKVAQAAADDDDDSNDGNDGNDGNAADGSRISFDTDLSNAAVHFEVSQLITAEPYSSNGVGLMKLSLEFVDKGQ